VGDTEGVNPSPPATPAPTDLTIPAGGRLVHIGPHKTGTTAIQAALFEARPALLAQGVRHLGRSRNPSAPVRAVTGQLSPYSDDETPPISAWQRFVAEAAGARESRTVVSSEFFAWAEPDAIRRIVDDLGGDRVHVAVTLRPLARILPSHWQQNIQAGTLAGYGTWLRATLFPDPNKPRPKFWTLQRHDELIARWAGVVGPERVTAIVLDERDHGFVLRVFEGLLGLREGTLAPVPDLANRSLTLPEVEAVRAFNAAFAAQGLPRALHAQVMRFGAAQEMKHREPPPDEARIETPQWALDRATEVAREMVAVIAASGVRVVGDLEPLAAPATSRLAGDDPPAAAIPPEVAASMAMGILVASGATRVAGAYSAQTLERAPIPTRQVAAVLGLRARNALGRRVRRLGRLMPPR
jgi:hypothetical protein